MGHVIFFLRSDWFQQHNNCTQVSSSHLISAETLFVISSDSLLWVHTSRRDLPGAMAPEP